jgi:hypothetical protein
VHPNPFNPATTIRFELEREALVSLVVHDLRGRRVASLPAEWFPSGDSEMRWLARNETGQALSSGVYSLTLMAGGETRSLRAVLVK